MQEANAGIEPASLVRLNAAQNKLIALPRMSSATATGITDHIWDLKDIIS